jgi:hypothetical protein
MSSNSLWNPALGPDMSGPRDLTQDKAEGSDMSELGVGHVQDNSLEPE